MTNEQPLTLREQLVLLAQAYGRAKKRSLATISTEFLSNGLILPRMAEGHADVTTGTFERAVLKFDKKWPIDLPWPAGIARPSLVADAKRTEAA
jgi:hypothetical protein